MRAVPTLLCLACCGPTTGVVLPVDTPTEDPVDIRVALVLEDEARAYDITRAGAVRLVASEPAPGTKSHIAISPDGTWWAFCDRPRAFGQALLHAGPLGEAVPLDLPPDCHHPSPDSAGAIAWAQFGDRSVLRRHDRSGRALPGDGTGDRRATLWHPRSDPSGDWVTVVRSSSSDIGPVVVLEVASGEVWSTTGDSRGGWRDVRDGVVVAASGDALLRVDLQTRVERRWPVFAAFGEACADLPVDAPCDLRPREVGLSDSGRVAVAAAPWLGVEPDRGWPLVLVDGPDEASVLAEDGGRYGWPLWGDSERWVYALRDSDEVVRVPVDGGPAEVLITGDRGGWSGWSGTR